MPVHILCNLVWLCWCVATFSTMVLYFLHPQEEFLPVISECGDIAFSFPHSHLTIHHHSWLPLLCSLLIYPVTVRVPYFRPIHFSLAYLDLFCLGLNSFITKVSFLFLPAR